MANMSELYSIAQHVKIVRSTLHGVYLLVNGTDTASVAIGARDYLLYLNAKNYQDNGQLLFHLSELTEESSITFDFIAIAFTKGFPFIRTFDAR